MNNPVVISDLSTILKEILNTADDEAIYQIMNCIRRTIIDEVPVVVLKDIIINSSISSGTLDVYNNEYIAQRIHCIPIYNSETNKSYLNKQLTIKYSNNSDTWAKMTPMNSFQGIDIEMDDNIRKDLPILYIPPHASFSCTVTLGTSSGMFAKYAHAWYDNNMTFYVESIGRTKNSDAYNVMHTAISTLINNVKNIKNSKIINSNDSEIKEEHTCITSRSVMNLIVTVFRIFASKITDNDYLFTVVQPHMSNSRVFKLLIQIKREDVSKLSLTDDLLQYAVNKSVDILTGLDSRLKDYNSSLVV